MADAVADEEAEIQRIEAHVEARFAALSANRRCPICQCEKWDIAYASEMNINVMVSPMGVFPAYVLFCKRCGYVQQFLRETFDGSKRAGGANG